MLNIEDLWTPTSNMLYRAPLITCSVGAVLIALAIILPLVFPSLFEKMLSKKLIVRSGSDVLKSYKKVPIPLYYQAYLFNLTNADDVLRGAKPKVQEVGPYTYRMTKERIDIKFNHSIGTVTGKSKKTYYFDREMSSGDLTDVVTTINLAYISLAAKASANKLLPAVRSIVQLLFTRFQLNPFMTHTVGELMFEGYEEPILKSLFPLTKKKAHGLGRTSLYYLKNGTVDSVSEMFTGELGMENYQHLHSFEGETKLNFWSEEKCNRLNGSEGSQFPRPLELDKRLYLFSPALCRSVYLTYEKDTTLGPLTLHRFRLSAEAMRKGPENACFCTSNFTCRSSTVDVTHCKGGTPIVISTPHFLDSDSETINSIEGLNPNKEHHETFLDIEPNTGVTMRVNKRIQINMPLKRYADFPALVDVPEVIFPVLWINESALVPLERANKLHKTLTVPSTIVKYGAVALLVIGLILITVACYLTYKVYKTNVALGKKRRQEQFDKIFEVSENNSILKKDDKNAINHSMNSNNVKSKNSVC